MDLPAIRAEGDLLHLSDGVIARVEARDLGCWEGAELIRYTGPVHAVRHKVMGYVLIIVHAVWQENAFDHGQNFIEVNKDSRESRGGTED